MDTVLQQKLVTLARAAAAHSYSPYSGFAVGAAIAAGSGRIYGGCNVENAAYGLTVCAEQVALLQAVAAGERQFSGLAIFTATVQPTPPCGACRQVLAEFCPGELQILCFAQQGPPRNYRLDQLLPAAFGCKNLQNHE